LILFKKFLIKPRLKYEALVNRSILEKFELALLFTLSCVALVWQTLRAIKADDVGYALPIRC
jgi:hypothetical protein